MAGDKPSGKVGGVESLKFAGDVCKQIITLSTAIIAVTVTFAKDLAPVKDGAVPPIIKFAWLGYAGAILFAVATMLSLAGSMHHTERSGAGFDIYRSNVRFPAFLMILAFMAGVGCTIAAGWSSVR